VDDWPSLGRCVRAPPSLALPHAARLRRLRGEGTGMDRPRRAAVGTEMHDRHGARGEGTAMSRTGHAMASQP